MAAGVNFCLLAGVEGVGGVGSSCGHVNRKVRVQREGLNLRAVYQLANEAQQEEGGNEEW